MLAEKRRRLTRIVALAAGLPAYAVVIAANLRDIWIADAAAI